MLQAGEREPLKAGVHAGLFALAVVCGAYNGLAFAVRREPHLACNFVVYVALAAFELGKVRHHLEDR